MRSLEGDEPEYVQLSFVTNIPLEHATAVCDLSRCSVCVELAPSPRAGDLGVGAGDCEVGKELVRLDRLGSARV